MFSFFPFLPFFLVGGISGQQRLGMWVVGSSYRAACEKPISLQTLHGHDRAIVAAATAVGHFHKTIR